MHSRVGMALGDRDCNPLQSAPIVVLKASGKVKVLDLNPSRCMIQKLDETELTLPGGLEVSNSTDVKSPPSGQVHGFRESPRWSGPWFELQTRKILNIFY